MKTTKQPHTPIVPRAKRTLAVRKETLRDLASKSADVRGGISSYVQTPRSMVFTGNTNSSKG